MRSAHIENVFNSMISDITYLKLAYYSNKVNNKTKVI